MGAYKGSLKMLKIIKLLRHPADYMSWFYMNIQTWWSGFYGTLFLRLKAWLFGVKLKGPVKCYGSVNILRGFGSEITIGKNVHLLSSCQRSRASSLYAPIQLRTHLPSSKIIIGDNVGLNGTSIYARSKTIRIGEGTLIAPNVVIVASDGHAMWPPENRIKNPAFEEDADIIIGKNVWIGMRSIILKGVTIGDNSVIAAGSVVTKSIPANVLAGGVPARVIRNLGDSIEHAK